MFQLTLLAAFVAVVNAGCSCDAESPLFVNDVDISAVGFEDAVLNIMTGVYQSATDILNRLGLDADDTERDYYKVISGDGCFEAEAKNAQVDYNGQSYSLSMQMVGEITEDGLKNSLCFCEAEVEDEDSDESGSDETVDLCNVLSQLTAQRLEDIKCSIEGNC